MSGYFLRHPTLVCRSRIATTESHTVCGCVGRVKPKPEHSKTEMFLSETIDEMCRHGAEQEGSLLSISARRPLLSWKQPCGPSSSTNVQL